MRKMVYSMLSAVLISLAPCVHGQDQASLQKALASQFILTKTTADKTDIVTPGAILALQKDGLLMWSIDTVVPPTNTYKNGKFSFGFGDKFAACFALSHAQPAQNCDTAPQRKFVAGEKVWVVNFEVKDDHVIFVLYSDPYADVRYYGQLKFSFQKHHMPPADELMKSIAEVVTVEPADSSSANAPPQPAATATPQSTDSMSGPPKTIALGQTKDQVVSTFGQPQRIVNLGAKEIYYYPDMKVAFVNGKVADVQ